MQWLVMLIGKFLIMAVSHIRLKTKGETTGSVATPTAVPVVSSAPIVTLAPIPTVASSGSSITGTEIAPTVDSAACKTGVDYNGDGIINSLDMRFCFSNGKGTSTGGLTPTQAAGVTPSACLPGVDYNGDGVINSLDMIKCRQN